MLFKTIQPPPSKKQPFQDHSAPSSEKQPFPDHATTANVCDIVAIKKAFPKSFDRVGTCQAPTP